MRYTVLLYLIDAYAREFLHLKRINTLSIALVKVSMFGNFVCVQVSNLSSRIKFL